MSYNWQNTKQGVCYICLMINTPNNFSAELVTDAGISISRQILKAACQKIESIACPAQIDM